VVTRWVSFDMLAPIRPEATFRPPVAMNTIGFDYPAPALRADEAEIRKDCGMVFRDIYPLDAWEMRIHDA